jgi:hypothetical protein
METPPLVGRELDLAVALEQLKRIQHGVPASLLVRGSSPDGRPCVISPAGAGAPPVNAVGLAGAFGLPGSRDRATFRCV